jgi:hypothetical protein
MGRRKKGRLARGLEPSLLQKAQPSKLILPKNETMPFHLRTEFIFALGDAFP